MSLLSENNTRRTWAKVSATASEVIPGTSLVAPTAGVTDANYTDYYTLSIVADGVAVGSGAFTYVPSTKTITFNPTIAQGAILTVQVLAKLDGRSVSYNTVGQLRGATLNQDAEQSYNVALEALETADRSMLLEPVDTTPANDVWDARERRITEVATPTADTDAATKGYVVDYVASIPGSVSEPAGQILVGIGEAGATSSPMLTWDSTSGSEHLDVDGDIVVTGDIEVAGNATVATPTEDGHATTKAYVDDALTSGVTTTSTVIALDENGVTIVDKDSLRGIKVKDGGDVLIGTDVLLQVQAGPVLEVRDDGAGTPYAELRAGTPDGSNENAVVTKEYGDAQYAALEGLSTQTFSVAAPTEEGHATTKAYVDDGLATKADLAGSDMQQFDVPVTPTGLTKAASKSYVDSKDGDTLLAAQSYTDSALSTLELEIIGVTTIKANDETGISLVNDASQRGLKIKDDGDIIIGNQVLLQEQSGPVLEIRDEQGVNPYIELRAKTPDGSNENALVTKEYGDTEYVTTAASVDTQVILGPKRFSNAIRVGSESENMQLTFTPADGGVAKAGFKDTLGSSLLQVDVGNPTTLTSAVNKLYADSTYAVVAGDASKNFSVAAPTIDAHASTKKYVDDGLGAKADKYGSTDNTFYVATPIAGGHAATKLYVDTEAGSAEADAEAYADGLVLGTAGTYPVYGATGITDGVLKNDTSAGSGVLLEHTGTVQHRVYTTGATDYAGYKAVSAAGAGSVELNVYGTTAVTRYGDSVQNDAVLDSLGDLYIGSIGSGKTVLGATSTKVLTIETTGATLSVEGTTDGHLVTKKYVDDGLGTKADIAGSSTQTFDVATPTADTHAATKLYVDSRTVENPLVLEDAAWGGGLDDDTMTLTVGTITNTDAGMTVKHLDDDGLAYRTAAVVFKNGGDLVLDPQYDYGATTFSRMPNVQTPVLSRFFVSSPYDAAGGATMDIGIGRGAAWSLRLLRSQYQGFVGVSDTDGAFMLGNTTSAGAYVGATLIKASSTGSTISSQDNLGAAKATTVATGLNVSGKATATTALVGKTGTPSKAMEIYHEGTTYGLRLSTADVGEAGYIDLGCNANGDLAISKPLPVASGGTGLSTLATGRIPYGAGTGDFGNSDSFVYSSGKLGVGTGTPTSTLHVKSSSRENTALIESTQDDANGGPYIEVSRRRASVAVGDTIGGMLFSANNASLAKVNYGIIRAKIEATTADAHSAGLSVFAANGGQLEEKVTLLANGNVGIGKTAPTKKLDVNGEIRASTGILFGTDTAAANTLDDYDSVNFTPEFKPQTGAFNTITYTYQHGRCIKIGKQVTLQIFLTTSNVVLGTATGMLSISGLPYAIRNTLPTGVAGSVAYMHTWGSDMSNVRVWGYRGDSVLGMTKNATNAASSAIQVSDLAVGAGNKNVIAIGITYFTD